MKLWEVVGGVAIACAACGGSTAPVMAPVVAMDAGSAASDGPAAMDGSDADASTPPSTTWSSIYSELLANAAYPSNCAGASCHDPGTQKGLDLSTREKGWSTIQHRLSPGKPDASELIEVLKSGSMPDGRPKMAPADIDRIAAWITAGAQDD